SQVLGPRPITPVRCGSAAGSSTNFRYKHLCSRGWPARGRDGKMPRFEWPWALLLLLAVPFLLRRRRRDDGGALGFNRVHTNLPRSSRERWLALPGVLRILAITLLIVTLAGPRLSGRRVREISKTIGLQLVLDCSGSMAASDMDYQGNRT